MSQMIEVPKPIYDALVGVFNAVDAVMTEDERPVDARIEDAAGVYISELQKYVTARFTEMLDRPAESDAGPQVNGESNGHD